MILIYTGFEDLDNKLKQKFDNAKIDSRIVFYEEYPLQEEKADVVVVSPRIKIKLSFKDYLFALRQRDKRVILLLDNEKSEHLGYALALGIYDIIFDPVTSDAIINRIKNPAKFSDVQELYLGLKGKVSFSGEEIIVNKEFDTKPNIKSKIEPEIKSITETKIIPEIKPKIESKIESNIGIKVVSEIKPEIKSEQEIKKNVIEIDINKEKMAIDQIEGMMKLLGYKLKQKDVNNALIELEQVLIKEIV